jgi:ferredoxin
MSADFRYEVQVDTGCCEGFGSCQAAAPQLFRLDPRTGLNITGTFQVGVDQVEAARRAAASCPEHAISVSDPTTS